MQPQSSLRPFYGALRSRIVSKLSGATMRQLQYWHQERIIEAHAIPGARGYPRLYSWVDYMKIRAAKKLLDQGLPERKMRPTIAYLDKEIVDWYRQPLYAVSGRPLITLGSLTVTADHTGQIALPELFAVIQAVNEEGPLGELRSFSDAIEMNPAVVAGNPVIKGTRLETKFLAALAGRGVTVTTIAEAYHLAPVQVQRALEFDRAVA